MYQALYRKWRPRTFDDVVGQPHITETLKSQVRSGRTSHAYLFIGTRGTGKTTCAKILAKAVNCENPVDGNPCNCCRVCRGIDDGSIMDVVEMDAASNNGVDNVRQLRDEAIFSPATAKRRVYIIDEVHMLSASAFNALLKILEEPPEHLLFILATTELNKVPATILSRCQRHSFRRLDTESIIDRLNYVAGQEGIDLTPEAARLLAARSEGGMRDALSMLDQCAGRDKIDADTVYSALGLAGNREIAALLERIAQRDSGGALERFGRLWADGKDPSTLLGELSTLLRDLLLETVAPRNGKELRSGTFDDDILDVFRGVFTAEALIARLNTIQAALEDMRSGQARMRCELCLIALCEPGLSDSLPTLRERIAALEQAVRNGIPAAPVGAGVPDGPNDAPVGRDVYAPASRVPSRNHDAHIAASPNDAPADAPPPDESYVWAGGSPPAAPDSAPVGAGVPDGPNDAPVDRDVYAPASRVPSRNHDAHIAASPAPGGTIWERLCGRLSGKFPPGTAMLIADPLQVGASETADAVTLTMRSDFAATMVDRPDVLASLSALASELAGRPMRVQTAAPGAAEAQRSTEELDRKLDALRQFEIVKFKQQTTED